MTRMQAEPRSWENLACKACRHLEGHAIIPECLLLNADDQTASASAILLKFQRRQSPSPLDSVLLLIFSGSRY